MSKENTLNITMRKSFLRIWAWLVLTAIPFFTMGWTIGKVNPSLDDWTMYELIKENRWFQIDPTRPLAFLWHTPIYYSSQIHPALPTVIIILLHGIAAICFFEVTRLLLEKWLEADASLAAFLVAVIYIFFPSDVARYQFFEMGNRIVHISYFLACLAWLQAIRRDRISLILIALFFMVIELLRSESLFFLFGLTPLVIFYLRSYQLPKRWWYTLVGWYAVMVAWIMWRLLVVDSDSQRPVGMPSISEFIQAPIRNLYVIILDPLYITIHKDLSALSQHSTLKMYAFALAVGFSIAILVMLWLYQRNADSLPKNSPTKAESSRIMGDNFQWLLFILVGLALYGAGLAPQMFRGVQRLTLTIEQTHSRLTAMPYIGISLLLIVLVLRRKDYVLAGLTCAMFLSFGVVRTVNTGQDVINVGEIGDQFWSEVLNLPTSWTDDTVVVVHNYPSFFGNGTTDDGFWAYTSAWNLFTGQENQFYSSNELILESVDDEGLHFTGNADVVPKLDVSLENLRIIEYIPQNRTIRMMSEVPAISNPNDVPTPSLITGINQQPTPVPTTHFVDDYIDLDNKIPTCITTVHVFTPDFAPEDGVLVTEQYPQNVVIDRRLVNQDERSDFLMRIPCGIWLRVYYEPDSSDERIQLISQYGADEEFGTASTETSSYHSSFAETLGLSTDSE